MLFSRVLLTSFLAAFAVAAMGNGLDRLSGISPGLERSVPIPFRAQSNRAAAATALARNDAAAALESSREAVASDPVDPDATASLGSALLLANRTGDAERTFRVAAKFGWRNARTQAFWYEVALEGREYEVAADRLDALLRVHPRLVDQVDVLQPMEGASAPRRVLAERLKLRPPWLAEYLDVTDDTPPDVIERRLSVISAIGPGDFQIGCELVAPFTRALLDNGRRRDAEAIWGNHCPKLKLAGIIADPTFSQVLRPTSANPFAWRVLASGDLSIRPAPGGEQSGGLLLINSAPGTRLTLLQAVALPAGVYKFHAERSKGAPPTAAKLYLSWACRGAPPFPATSGGDLQGTGQEIKVTACDRQQIGIWLTGGGASATLRALAWEKEG